MCVCNLYKNIHPKAFPVRPFWTVSLWECPIHKGLLCVHFMRCFQEEQRCSFNQGEIYKVESQILILALSLRDVNTMNQGKAEFLFS